jgi:hypothetical protein
MFLPVLPPASLRLLAVRSGQSGSFALPVLGFGYYEYRALAKKLC